LIFYNYSGILKRSELTPTIMQVKTRLDQIPKVVLDLGQKPPQKKKKGSKESKKMIPMTPELREELKSYVWSKNMRLSLYLSGEKLNTMSFYEAKKAIDDLIKESNKHTY